MILGTKMEKNEIDLIEFGVLCQKVQELDKKMDKMERHIEELLALANKSKGGFWMGMTIASVAGGFLTWLLTHWNRYWILFQSSWQRLLHLTQLRSL